MIQRGSRVYIVPRDSRHSPYYVVVEKIGKKYITVVDNPSCNRFDIRTKESIDDRTGWNPCLKLYESKEVYEKEKLEEELHANLITNIKLHIQSASIEKLRQIYNILKNEKD